MMTATDRAPLVVGPSHIRGLIEFARADCPTCRGDLCPDCVELASRAELQVALRASRTRDMRMGQTWLSESDVTEILRQLDAYDGGRA